MIPLLPYLKWFGTFVVQKSGDLNLHQDFESMGISKRQGDPHQAIGLGGLPQTSLPWLQGSRAAVET